MCVKIILCSRPQNEPPPLIEFHTKTIITINQLGNCYHPKKIIKMSSKIFAFFYYYKSYPFSTMFKQEAYIF